MSKQSLHILLVEDNPGDVRLIQEALGELLSHHHLRVVHDGVDAMKTLYRQPPYEHEPRPDLILLDLNLPRKDGREVLAEIKSDDALKDIPVVILTTSSADQDIISSYQLHANCFVTKPIDLDQFIRVIHSLGEFWLSLVQLPPKE